MVLEGRTHSDQYRQMDRLCTLTGTFRQLTQQFLSQCGELLDGQASFGGGGELPAQDLGHLVPCGHRGLGEEVDVLRGNRTHTALLTLLTKEERGVGLVTGVQSCLHQGAPTYLWVVGEHVVPQDGGPGVWHLADVGDDNHWQGVSLQNGEFTVSRRLLHRELSSQ